MMHGMDLKIGIVLLALLLVPAAVSADDYVGGVPLTTAESGTVSGGVFVDAYPGFATEASKTFTLPEGAEVRWARLYVVVYCGNMEENYNGKVKVDFDGGGGTRALGTEDLDVAYSFPGDGGSGPVWVNDHCTRVTSDYLMWYDVAVTSGTAAAHVKTEKVSPKFDGRIKAIVLVAAYDDGDGDQVQYWVNEGQDTDSYRADENNKPYVGETDFSTGDLEGDCDEATLSVLYLASANGVYTFCGDELDADKPQGSYFGHDTHDVTDLVTPGRDSALTYDRVSSESFYKIFLSVLSMRYAGDTTGSIAVHSDPPGATVFIDDEEQGVTNTTVTDLEPGEYGVRVEMEGYETPDEATVSVEGGKTENVSFSLTPLLGSIEVGSEPEGASVFLDGEDTGQKTDTVLEDVRAGHHTVTLTLDGYETVTQDVEVETESPAEVSVEMRPTSSSDGSSDGKDAGSGYAGTAFEVVRQGTVLGGVFLTTAGNYTGLIPAGERREFSVRAGLPGNATLSEGWLSLYTTWGHDESLRTGKGALLSVSVNGTPVVPDARYSDRKGEGAYDYPVETFAYNVTDLIGSGNMTVAVTNGGSGGETFALYGCALLTVGEVPGAPEREYWIAEGADVLLAGSTGDATTTAAFTDVPSPDVLSAADLLVVSTAASGGEGGDHLVTFNGGEWDNPLQGGSSAISAVTLDVLPSLSEGECTAGITSVSSGEAGDYMENRLMALVVTRAENGTTPVALTPPRTTTAATETVSLTVSPHQTTLKDEDRSSVFGWVSSLVSDLLDFFGFDAGTNGSAEVEEPVLPVTTGTPNALPPATPAPPENASLLVLSEPEGASIYLDGEYTGRTTPFVFPSLAPGNHTLEFEHESYGKTAFPLSLEGEQTFLVNLSDGNRTLSAGVADMPDEGTGSIFVDSTPPGVQIIFDGRKTSWETPHVISGVKPGLHTVKIKDKTALFPVNTKKCYVEPGIVSAVRFDEEQCLMKSVTVTSETNDKAELSVNGMRINGKIPKKVTIAGLNSFVSVRNASGYFSLAISDFIEDGAEFAFEPDGPASASVQVTSVPAGADILVDGFDTGYATPYTLTDLSEGPHLVAVSRPGYIPQEERINLFDDEETAADAMVSFNLEPYPCGALTVTSEPGGGKIYLHGKNTGEVTPHTFPCLSIGTYDVKVVLGNVSAQRDDVTVIPHSSVLASFDLAES